MIRISRCYFRGTVQGYVSTDVAAAPSPADVALAARKRKAERKKAERRKAKAKDSSASR